MTRFTEADEYNYYMREVPPSVPEEDNMEGRYNDPFVLRLKRMSR